MTNFPWVKVGFSSIILSEHVTLVRSMFSQGSSKLSRKERNSFDIGHNIQLLKIKCLSFRKKNFCSSYSYTIWSGGVQTLFHGEVKYLKYSFEFVCKSISLCQPGVCYLLRCILKHSLFLKHLWYNQVCVKNILLQLINSWHTRFYCVLSRYSAQIFTLRLLPEKWSQLRPVKLGR